MSFVHLQVRSAYSMLESSISLEELVVTGAKNGYKKIALTDINVLYGVIKFYNLCKQYNIEPIIGLTITIKETGSDKGYPLVVLAANQRGYYNLLQITTEVNSNLSNSITLSHLKQFSEGLIGITAGFDGEIETCLEEQSVEKAAQTLKKYLQVFPKRNFYISLHKNPKKSKFTCGLKEFARANDIELVANYRVLYVQKNDAIIYRTLKGIKNKKQLRDVERETIDKKQYFVLPEEAKNDFITEKEAYENTWKIAERCRVDLQFTPVLLPKFPLKQKIDSFSYLVALCQKGFIKRFSNPTKEHYERLHNELNVIKKLNFADYFLIVYDYVSYGKKNNIRIGPGRGSVSGSIVAYVLGITEVDPIKYNLIFERFLNPERISMPDIDIDIADQRREQIIKYMEEKYGQDHVAQIITFNTFGIKSAIRDVGEVLGLSPEEISFFVGKLPISSGKTFGEMIQSSQIILNIMKEKEIYKTLCKIAIKIIGLPRQTSIHAAGIILAQKKLVTIIPLQKQKSNFFTSQFPMKEAESIGLLKFDLLGLKNLSLIENILQCIYRHTKERVDLNKIAFNNVATYELLQNGNTLGIFQLESDGMRNVLKQIKPTCFEDLIAVISLYRPGPQDSIATFIRRKHSQEKIQYLHHDLEPILATTYGIIVYQEQIMRILTNIAKFTFAEADVIRRAISKKDQELLKVNRDLFIKRAVENGYELNVSEKIYSDIVKFANYGFNRSHAVAYSMISYQMAYLKANFPLYFTAEMLNNVINDRRKTELFLNEGKMNGLQILPPSLTKSQMTATIEGDGYLRLGFSIIKSMNKIVIINILEERKAKQFNNFFDFYARLPEKILDDNVVSNMIHAGCFDEFNRNRAVLLASMKRAKKNNHLKAPSLKALSLTMKYEEAEPLNPLDQLEAEREVLGIYLSAHPLEMYEIECDDNKSITQVLHFSPGQNVLCYVCLYNYKIIRTSQLDEMAFLTMGDLSGKVEAVLFPKTYKLFEKILKIGNVYITNGKLDLRNNNLQLVISGLKEATKKIYR